MLHYIFSLKSLTGFWGFQPRLPEIFQWAWATAFFHFLQVAWEARPILWRFTVAKGTGDYKQEGFLCDLRMLVLIHAQHLTDNKKQSIC